jgi:hypothetical protein
MIDSRQYFAYASGSVFLLLATVAPLPARTITLTAEDCDQMAAISADAPRLSWAMTPSVNGVFNAQPEVRWNSKIGVLMRFPFNDLIPKGQRVTKAELTLTATFLDAREPKVTVRRLLAEWGTGVCHQYRIASPFKVEWTQAGGRGAATDRAAKDSAVFKWTQKGPQTVDLTEDVELWYTGAAANRGWIFTMETAGEHVYVPSPYAPHAGGGKQWKLQLTYEPK